MVMQDVNAETGTEFKLGRCPLAQRLFLCGSCNCWWLQGSSLLKPGTGALRLARDSKHSRNKSHLLGCKERLVGH